MIPIIYKKFCNRVSHSTLFTNRQKLEKARIAAESSKFCVNYFKYENVSNLIEKVTPNYFSIFSK